MVAKQILDCMLESRLLGHEKRATSQIAAQGEGSRSIKGKREGCERTARPGAGRWKSRRNERGLSTNESDPGFLGRHHRSRIP